MAAPSRAAALRAWGADTDLFAMGAAVVVTDSDLTVAPLIEPGKVIKVSRGSASQHVEALEKIERSTKPAPIKKRRARSKVPKPSRSKLDQAEVALEVAVAKYRSSLALLGAEIDELRTQRDALVARNDATQAKLEHQVQTAKGAYGAALAKWREAIS